MTVKTLFLSQALEPQSIYLVAYKQFLSVLKLLRQEFVGESVRQGEEIAAGGTPGGATARASRLKVFSFRGWCCWSHRVWARILVDLSVIWLTTDFSTFFVSQVGCFLAFGMTKLHSGNWGKKWSWLKRSLNDWRSSFTWSGQFFWNGVEFQPVGEMTYQAWWMKLLPRHFTTFFYYIITSTNTPTPSHF